jgi:hypothetical protein
MSGLRILPFGLLALTLFGQSENNAVPNPGAAIDQAVRGIIQKGLTASNSLPSPRPLAPRVLSGGATKCAIPLLETPIPADKNFVIGRLNPPKNFIDDMVVAQGLLPACGLKE